MLPLLPLFSKFHFSHFISVSLHTSPDFFHFSCSSSSTLQPPSPTCPSLPKFPILNGQFWLYHLLLSDLAFFPVGMLISMWI